jgi:hypothetical protein
MSVKALSKIEADFCENAFRGENKKYFSRLQAPEPSVQTLNQAHLLPKREQRQGPSGDHMKHGFSKRLVYP